MVGLLDLPKDVIWIITSRVIYEHFKEINWYCCIYGGFLPDSEDHMKQMIDNLASINSLFYNILKTKMIGKGNFKKGAFSQFICNHDFSSFNNKCDECYKT